MQTLAPRRHAAAQAERVRQAEEVVAREGAAVRLQVSIPCTAARVPGGRYFHPAVPRNGCFWRYPAPAAVCRRRPEAGGGGPSGERPPARRGSYRRRCEVGGGAAPLRCSGGG
jgi:hypothetical protein